MNPEDLLKSFSSSSRHAKYIAEAVGTNSYHDQFSVYSDNVFNLLYVISQDKKTPFSYRVECIEAMSRLAPSLSGKQLKVARDATKPLINDAMRVQDIDKRDDYLEVLGQAMERFNKKVNGLDTGRLVIRKVM